MYPLLSLLNFFCVHTEPSLLYSLMLIPNLFLQHHCISRTYKYSESTSYSNMHIHVGSRAFSHTQKMKLLNMAQTACKLAECVSTRMYLHQIKSHFPCTAFQCGTSHTQVGRRSIHADTQYCRRTHASANRTAQRRGRQGDCLDAWLQLWLWNWFCKHMNNSHTDMNNSEGHERALRMWISIQSSI